MGGGLSLASHWSAAQYRWRVRDGFLGSSGSLGETARQALALLRGFMAEFIFGGGTPLLVVPVTLLAWYAWRRWRTVWWLLLAPLLAIVLSATQRYPMGTIGRARVEAWLMPWVAVLLALALDEIAQVVPVRDLRVARAETASDGRDRDGCARAGSRRLATYDALPADPSASRGRCRRGLLGTRSDLSGRRRFPGRVGAQTADDVRHRPTQGRRLHVRAERSRSSDASPRVERASERTATRVWGHRDDRRHAPAEMSSTAIGQAGCRIVREDREHARHNRVPRRHTHGDAEPRSRATVINIVRVDAGGRAR